MEIKALTTYKLDSYDSICVTTHEGTGNTISLHCSHFAIGMSAVQAGQIGAELTAASMVIESREEADGDT